MLFFCNSSIISHVFAADLKLDDMPESLINSCVEYLQKKRNKNITDKDKEIIREALQIKTPGYPQEITTLISFKILFYTAKNLKDKQELLAKVLFDLTIQPIKFFSVLARAYHHAPNFTEVVRQIDAQEKKIDQDEYGKNNIIIDQVDQNELIERRKKYCFFVVTTFLFSLDESAHLNDPIVSEFNKLIQNQIKQKATIDQIIDTLYMELVKQQTFKTNNMESLARPNRINSDKDSAPGYNYLIKLSDGGYDQLTKEEWMEYRHIAERFEYIHTAVLKDRIQEDAYQGKKSGLNKFESEYTFNKVKNDPIYMKIYIPHILKAYLKKIKDLEMLKYQDINLTKRSRGVSDFESTYIFAIISLPLFFFVSCSDDKILQDEDIYKKVKKPKKISKEI